MSRKILSCKSVSKHPKLATIKRQSVSKQRLLERAKELPKATLVPSRANSSVQNNNRNSLHQSDFSRGGDWVLLQTSTFQKSGRNPEIESQNRIRTAAMCVQQLGKETLNFVIITINLGALRYCGILQGKCRDASYARSSLLQPHSDTRACTQAVNTKN